MKKILLTLLTATFFQTPVFAEVTLSKFDLYMQGKIRGVLFCQALQNGARTVQDIARYKEEIDNADINLADRIYYLASPEQRVHFSNGWKVYISQNCLVEFERLIDNRNK